MIISIFICGTKGVGAPKKFIWRELLRKTREGIGAVVALAIGLVTPPVGASLFIACDISKAPLLDAFEASLLYLGGVLLTLTLMILFPGIVTYFPNLLVR